MKSDLRRHRNLYNGDCTFLFGQGYRPDTAGPYTAQVMHDFIDLIADSGVDTFLCNPNAQRAWYPSKAFPHILEGYTRGNREFFRRHYPPPNETDFTTPMLESVMTRDAEFLDRYLDLAEAGVDWVAEISKACRRRGVSPWVSIRMNDMHGANDLQGSYMNGPELRNPQLRLRGVEPNPRDGVSRVLMALNYEKREVRDSMFRLVRELVEDYDFEGIELDWLRCPYICEPPATEEAIQTMIAWIGSIRALTRARSKALGKPYPLGVRIPCRLGLLRSVGLDVAALARSGLIDFVSPSNSWQTSWDVPYERLRADLAGEVAIYGVIEDAPNWLDAFCPDTGARGYRLLSASGPLLRANAAGKLALGVDGIETFNFFCTDEEGIHPTAAKRQALYPELRGLDDLGGLRGKPKHYALALNHGPFNFPLFEFAEQVPAVVEPAFRHAFHLPMAAEPAGLELTVQTVVEKPEHMPDLGVSFNGSWPNFSSRLTSQLLFPTGQYTHHVPEHQALDYTFPASLIREGWNEVLLIHGGRERATREQRARHSVNVVSVELAVRQPE
ncbi:MAG: hypothetical protein HYU36_10060 [Planctomycetes bacterium]|nr:hypothetical protein [Planctomycetota bacterium]